MAVWSTPKTWNVGDVLTAADMNTYVRDNSGYLHGDSGAVSLAESILFGASGKGTLRGLRHTFSADYHVCVGSIAMSSDVGSGSTGSGNFDRAFTATPFVGIGPSKAMNGGISISPSTSALSVSAGGSAGAWTLYYIAIGAS